MKNTVRLKLPDGGSFDLPTGDYGGRLEVNGLGASGGVDLLAASSPPNWPVIVVGAVLGGLFTWMLTRLD